MTDKSPPPQSPNTNRGPLTVEQAPAAVVAPPLAPTSVPSARRRADARLMGTAAAVIALTTIFVALVFDRVNFDVVVGAIVCLALVAITIPELQLIARKDGAEDLFKLLVAAFVLKMIFSMIRYYVITTAYGDNADAGVYSYSADLLAKRWRSGTFTLTPPGLETRPAESQRISVVLAAFYLVTGTSRYAGTFIFTWLCFQGQLAMCAAFKLAVPGGDIRRYRLLVMFMPSMLFWPSSIGKESLMIAAVGLVSYGAASILSARARISGVAVFIGGVAGLMFIRPHMAMIAITGLGFASAIGSIRAMRERGATRSASIRLAALVILIVMSVGVATQLTAFFGSGTDGVAGVLASTTNQTSTGGSEFVPIAVTNPLLLPAAAVTVLIRPFPWEAGNVNGIIASLEGVLLVGLIYQGRRRIRNLPKQIVQHPYLAFAATYAVIFIIAFSYIGNFGILARQRTQMLPLALTALAIPPATVGIGETMQRRGRKRQRKPVKTSTQHDEMIAETTYLSRLVNDVPHDPTTPPTEMAVPDPTNPPGPIEMGSTRGPERQ